MKKRPWHSEAMKKYWANEETRARRRRELIELAEKRRTFYTSK